VHRSAEFGVSKKSTHTGGCAGSNSVRRAPEPTTSREAGSALVEKRGYEEATGDNEEEERADACELPPMTAQLRG
jgi:hypothetical protein